MRKEVTRDRLELLMQALAREAPRRGTYKVYLVGGGTAIYAGWRNASVDVDLCSDGEAVFRNIQRIKEQLAMNIEFARPEDFVPPLKGSAERHLFIETVGRVSFYHYDPYAQLLAKVVRGFQRDLDDARAFIRSKMVEPRLLNSLVSAIPESAYARYPNLSRKAVESAVRGFLDASGP